MNLQFAIRSIVPPKHARNDATISNILNEYIPSYLYIHKLVKKGFQIWSKLAASYQHHTLCASDLPTTLCNVCAYRQCPYSPTHIIYVNKYLPILNTSTRTHTTPNHRYRISVVATAAMVLFTLAVGRLAQWARE